MWTIQSVNLSWRDQVSNIIFGHIFTVQILMRYTPGGAGNAAFIESPHLTWKEKIFFNKHKDKSYWHWEGDLFVNRPLASTFHVVAPSIYRGLQYRDYGALVTGGDQWCS